MQQRYADAWKAYRRQMDLYNDAKMQYGYDYQQWLLHKLWVKKWQEYYRAKYLRDLRSGSTFPWYKPPKP
jgi:hypothetical protein